MSTIHPLLLAELAHKKSFHICTHTTTSTLFLAHLEQVLPCLLLLTPYIQGYLKEHVLSVWSISQTMNSRYRTLFSYKPGPMLSFFRHTLRSRFQNLDLFRRHQKFLGASEAEKKQSQLHHFLGKK